MPIQNYGLILGLDICSLFSPNTDWSDIQMEKAGVGVGVGRIQGMTALSLLSKTGRAYGYYGLFHNRRLRIFEKVFSD